MKGQRSWTGLDIRTKGVSWMKGETSSHIYNQFQLAQVYPFQTKINMLFNQFLTLLLLCFWFRTGILFLLHVEKSQTWQACCIVAKLWLDNLSFKTVFDSDLVSLISTHSSAVSRQPGHFPSIAGFGVLFLHLALLSYSNNLGESNISWVLIKDDMLTIWKNSHLSKESGLSCYENNEANYGS